MVETVRPNFTQFSPRESGLVVPERRILTNEDLAEMFGVNYKERIVEKAKAVGINDSLIFFDFPMPHEGSEAVYLAQQYVGDDLVLVPVLGPNRKTSKHSHQNPMLKEVYFHVDGESFVNVNGKTFVLDKTQDRIEVPLGVSHQVTTRDKPALTLIIMEKARLVPPGRLHIRDIE